MKRASPVRAATFGVAETRDIPLILTTALKFTGSVSILVLRQFALLRKGKDLRLLLFAFIHEGSYRTGRRTFCSSIRWLSDTDFAIQLLHRPVGGDNPPQDENQDPVRQIPR